MAVLTLVLLLATGRPGQSVVAARVRERLECPLVFQDPVDGHRLAQRARVVVELLHLDVVAGGLGTSGCEASDYDGVPEGAIIIVQRGTCTFGDTGLTARFKVDWRPGTYTTSSVIAETPGGDPDNVIAVGAHLDTVGVGPGIQDNGSGSAAILEIAEQMTKVKPRNTVRFLWFGAEESGLLGSEFY